MLQTYVFVPRLEKEAKVAKLNSQKRLTIKRRPQIFHIQSEEKKRKAWSISAFSLGFLNSDGLEKETWKKNNFPYCGKIPGSEVFFSVRAEVVYLLFKKQN